MGHAVVAKLLAKSQGALQIVVISEENYPAYNRVKLTTFFEHRDPNQLALSSALFLQIQEASFRKAKFQRLSEKGKCMQMSLRAFFLVEAQVSSGASPMAWSSSSARRQRLIVVRNLSSTQRRKARSVLCVCLQSEIIWENSRNFLEITLEDFCLAR